MFVMSRSSTCMGLSPWVQFQVHEDNLIGSWVIIRTDGGARDLACRSQFGHSGARSPSQPDKLAVWLSAKRYALIWAGLKPLATCTGISCSPSLSAAL